MQLSSGSVKSEINVTPLVDVVLVLLIIFMVVTPMLQKGQSVKLPMTSNPAKKPDDKNQILVVVAQNKDMWIDKEKVGEALFPAKIKEAFDRNPGSSVVIKADRMLTYGDVKKTMLQVKGVGYQQVGLITEKKEK